MTARGWRVALLVAILGVAGCSFAPAPSLQVRVRNHTDTPARIEMVRFNFSTGEAGAAIGSATNLIAGGATTLQVRVPHTRDWALQINGIPAVTSLDWEQAERAMPGEGPLSISVDVRDGALEVQTTRGDPGGGVTTAPAPN